MKWVAGFAGTASVLSGWAFATGGQSIGTLGAVSLVVAAGLYGTAASGDETGKRKATIIGLVTAGALAGVGALASAFGATFGSSLTALSCAAGAGFLAVQALRTKPGDERPVLEQGRHPKGSPQGGRFK